MAKAGTKSAKKSGKKSGKTSGKTSGKKPKKKCCLSTPRCSRCPLRMLAEGTLPDGYTVRKRKLIRAATLPTPADGPKDKDQTKRTHKGKGKGKGKRPATRAGAD